jgi:hypothetical protein
MSRRKGRNKVARAILCVFGGSLAIAHASRAARADEPRSFVQITCAPELGYFSIRRFTIMNVPPKGPYLTEGFEPATEVVIGVEHKYGIFESEGLQARPFECSIPALSAIPGWERARHGFTVRVLGHLDKDSQETSYCRIRDDAEVVFNGKSIGLIGLNPCRSAVLDSIEIAHDGVGLAITKCEVPYDSSLDDKGHLTCSMEPVASTR